VDAVREARVRETSTERAAQHRTNVEAVRKVRAHETSTERAAQRHTDAEARREAKAREISTQLMSENEGDVAERAKRVKLLVCNMYTCSLVIPYLNMIKEARLECNQSQQENLKNLD